MKNLDVRKIISGNGLRYKEVAKELGITPEWLSRLMKTTLSQKNKDRILEAVERLKGADPDDIR